MFRRYKLSKEAKKLIFSALQTFGHFFVRKFVASKLLGINVLPFTDLIPKLYFRKKIGK